MIEGSVCLQSGSVVSTSSYDGLGRRISKAVSNSADWNCTYAYYHDGQRVIEIRNGSDQAIKQQVWGMQYVDELLQVGLNPSPSSGNTCSTMYWAMQDANWNVLGVVDSSGVLKERYEYTPYGQRTVFFGPGSNDPGCYAATVGSRRFVTSGSVTQPYGICEIGHQGLGHDEENELANNRARILHSTIARFSQRDPLSYIDGMNLYVSARSNPLRFTDPDGTDAREDYFNGKNPKKVYWKPACCSGNNCKWSGFWKLSAVGFGGLTWSSSEFTFTGRDDSGCVYTATGTGSERQGLGSQMVAAGWVSITHTISNYKAVCTWPIDTGDDVSSETIGYGGAAGVPLSAAITKGYAGDFYDKSWGNINMAGGIHVNLGMIGLSTVVDNIKTDITVPPGQKRF